MSELEVAWTQAMATAAAREGRRPAPQKPRPDGQLSSDIVLGCLAELHSATMREIHERTGLSMQHVNSALYILLQRGRVSRSHRQQDDHRRPVQWRLRG